MNAFLIADDSDAKRMLMKAVLRHAKWEGEILVAETTEQAMQLMRDHPDIGFAFIDYYIPSHNGPAIISNLKQQNPKARIALISSSEQQKNIGEAKAAGAEAFICTTWEGDRAETEMLALLEEWKG